jgi:hypothetical protein
MTVYVVETAPDGWGWVLADEAAAIDLVERQNSANGEGYAWYTAVEVL